MRTRAHRCIRHNDQAEARRKHHLQLDAAGVKTDQVRKGASDVCGCTLKRRVQLVEDVRDRIDKEQQAQRKQDGTPKPYAPEQQRDTAAVEEEQ